MMLKQKKQKTGFSIIETMVAISILMLVLTGATSLVNLSLRTIASFQNELIATMLAQEGIEYVRWQRDSNRINFPTPNQWMQKLLIGVATPCRNVFCYAELDSATGDVTWTTCPGDVCPPIQFNPTTGIYSYEITAGSIQTSFVRNIRVIEVSNDEVRVNVWVTWPNRFTGTLNIVRAKEVLLNWQ